MSTALAWTLLAVVILAALAGWLGAFWRRLYAFDPGYEEVHLVRTADGWCIGLFRYPPPAGGHGRPVILCHGLAANRYNFDLGPEKSLARYLQERGFDVWVLELRGRGYSLKIGKKMDRYRRPYVFDDYVRQDAPAALDHVRRVTGARQVHWVGHSMGGLILYGLLQGPRAGEIASGVAVASPGDFRNVRRIPALLPLWRLGRFLPRIQQRFLAAVFAPVVPWLPGRVLGLVYNPANVDRILVLRALCYLVSDVSRGEMLQFYDGMRREEFRSFDGSHSYAEGFARMERPLMLLAGSRDALCPPRSIEGVHRAMRSPDKELRIFGREFGEQEEYGHGDLLIGKHCETEVFPYILRWLAPPGQGAPDGRFPKAS